MQTGTGQVEDGLAEGSILQVYQLTELKPTEEWERYPNRFRRLYETLLPKQKCESTVENGQQGKRSQRSSISLKTTNRKPQDLSVYSDSSFTKRPVRMELQCQARCEDQP